MGQLTQKELSLSINRFQRMLTKVDADQEDLIRNAYYLIRNFGEVDSNFREVFAGMQGRLKDFLFISEADICLAYKLKEGTTYKRAIRTVDRLNRDAIAARDSTIVNLQARIEMMDKKYKAQILSQSQEIVKCREEIEKYKQLADTTYVQSLERKIAELKESIASQEEEYRALAKKNEDISYELLQTRNSLEDQQLKCSDLQAQIYDLNVDKEQLEGCLLKIKDRFEELSSRMEGLKDIIQKVEAQNESLVSERAKLVNRAAVTFQELTPRPQYSGYFSVESASNLKPSRQIFETLFGQIPGSRQEYCQKYFLSKKSRKLQQCEAIRQLTLEEVGRSTARISRLMGV